MARRPSSCVSALLAFAAGAWLCAPAAVHARPFQTAALQAPAAAQAVEASPVLARLKQVAGVLDVKPLPQGPRVPADSYDLTFEQPVDHRNASGAKFQQHVFLTHVGFDRPVLLGTEGYAARGPAGGELQRMLGSNTVTVEHRFFGRSVPSPVDWTYLTVRQSADDLHAVFAALKALYPGKWVSTGASKGGQTSLFYKSYHPEDMDAVVAYVAPVNLAQEDPRANRLIETIGDEASRKRLRDFQLAMFDREDEVLPLVKAEADKRKWTFGLGLAAAYEYGVLEHPYAFCHYGTSPSEIPAPDAPADVLAAHYNKVGALYYYSDQGKKQFEPFMYQAFVEIGYYNYDTTPFNGHMKALKNPTNAVLCPDGAKIVYDPSTMAFVYDFLRYKANRVIYIYGELDMWSSTQMQLLGRTDAVKFLVAGAHHGAHVANFSPEQKELFYSTMERWLGMKLTRS